MSSLHKNGLQAKVRYFFPTKFLHNNDDQVEKTQ